MSREIDVKSIVKSYLRAHDYDGLVHPWGDCACLVANLMPCDGCSDADFSDCVAGHRVSIVSGACEKHGADCTWHVVAGKRPSPKPTEAAEL